MNCSLSTDHHLMEDFLLFPVCQLISVSQELIYVPRSRLPKNISYIFKHVSLKKKYVSNTAEEQINVSVRGAEKVEPAQCYTTQINVWFHLNVLIKSWLNVNCFKLYKNN